MSSDRAWFVVDTDGTDAAERARVCRTVLESVRAMVVKGETDMPFWNRAEWTPEVADAADRLRHRFATVDDRGGGYSQTGMQDLRDPDVWTDFVTVVPEALDASVWSRIGCLVQLSDCADSVCVHADEDLRKDLEARLGPDVLHAARVTVFERLARWTRRMGRRVNRS